MSTPLTPRDILRPGIAGYIDPSHPSIAETGEGELKVFRRAVYAAAIAVSGRITHFAPADPGSYYAATIKSPHGATEHILCHAVFPYVAFVAALDPFDLRFIDNPRLIPFFAPPLLILPPTLLEAPLTIDDDTLKSLDKGTQSAIKCFKPRRLGDLIFNWYD